MIRRQNDKMATASTIEFISLLVSESYCQRNDLLAKCLVSELVCQRNAQLLRAEVDPLARGFRGYNSAGNYKKKHLQANCLQAD